MQCYKFLVFEGEHFFIFYLRVCQKVVVELFFFHEKIDAKNQKGPKYSLHLIIFGFYLIA